jgi:hypothetical protein
MISRNCNWNCGPGLDPNRSFINLGHKDDFLMQSTMVDRVDATDGLC